MALTHLDKLPSYEEWKENNPVDARGIPLGQDELQLRAGYAHYLLQQAKSPPKGFETPNSDELGMVGNKVANFIADALEERTDEGVAKAFDEFYSVPAEEKAERIFREQVDGGVGGTAPPYILLSEAVNGHELRAQLDAQFFDPNEYFRITDKIDKISGPNKRKPTVRMDYVGGKAIFRSEADDQPDLWSVSEEERAYVDQFSDLVSQYSEKIWPDYKQLVHRRLGASVVEIPVTDPDTGDTGAGFIFADNVPEEEREASVDRAVREGLLDFRNKDHVLDVFANGLKLKNSDERLPVKSANYFEAQRMIGTALKEGSEHSRSMMLQLQNLVQQVVLSHSKAGGDVPSFVESGAGSFVPQTELVETDRKGFLAKIGSMGRAQEITNQNYEGAIKDFRSMFRGSSEHLSDEVIAKAFQTTAYRMASLNTLLPYHEAKMRFVSGSEKKREVDSATRIAQNIYTTEFGEKIIHPGLLVSKIDFEVLQENAEEFGTTKEALTIKRLAYLQSKYDYFLANIFNSTADIRNSWIAHVGKTTDGTQSELLEVSPGQWVGGEGDAEVLASWLDSETGRNY